MTPSEESITPDDAYCFCRAALLGNAFGVWYNERK